MTNFPLPFRDINNRAMAVLWLALLWLAGLSGTGPVAAQNLPGPASSPRATSARHQSTSYRLGAGDVLKIYVQGYEEYSHAGVLVLPDGTFSLPIYGTLKATGKTIAQLQNDLRNVLGRRMRDPKRLTLSVVQPRPAEEAPPTYMYVIGAVKTPGRVEIKPDYRLTEVLAAVGGVAARLDEVEARLTRAGAPPVPLDLYAVMTQPSSSRNLVVRENDVLTVTEIPAARLTVIGDVVRPGVYELRRVPRPGANELSLHPRLSEVLLTAGGLKTLPAPAAQPVDASGEPPEPEYSGTLMRDNQEIPLQPAEALNGRDDAANIELQPGDLISVKLVPPPPPLEVFVDGLVRSPGKVQLPPGASVVDAIVKANGITRAPDEIVTTIWRNGKTLPLDLKSALISSDAAANVPLQSNDILQLKPPESIQVQMMGQVAKPQTLSLPTDAHMLDAIVQAGGLTIKPEDARIKVLRNLPNGEWKELNVDPKELIELSAAQNIALRPNDFISVTPLEQEIKKVRVFVRGQVTKPGPYELNADTASLRELLIQAGGPAPDAALTQISVRRGDDVQVIDMYGALTRGDDVDFPLQDQDFVVVPEIPNKIMVMEAVNKPGFVTIPEKQTLTLFGAIQEAGGLRADAYSREVVVMRQKGPGQEVEKQVYSLDLVKDGSTGANVTLQSGDVVYVPRTKPSRGFWDKVVKTVSTIGVFGMFF